MLLLSPTCCAIRAVRSLRDARFEKTFLSFTDPPVLKSVQEHFCGAHPTNPLSRDIEAGLRARWHAMDVYEQVKLNQWRKFARLRQDMLHDLSIAC